MAKIDDVKKRKPPTFQHLPEIRAKKLKRTWVQAQKIKSQWKAQKRREGLLLGGKNPVTDSADIDGRSESRAEEGSGSEAVSSTESILTADNAEQEGSGESDGRDAKVEVAEPVEVIEPTPSTQRIPPFSNGIKRKHPSKPGNDNRSKVARLNEPSSRVQPKLSSHGSRTQFQKRETEPRIRSATGDRGSARGNARGGSHRGRGQPNMGIRMNAMLEKIRRDFA